MNLKATFQTGKLIFLYVIITSPSYSKADKQIGTCIEWMASDKILKKGMAIVWLQKIVLWHGKDLYPCHCRLLHENTLLPEC